jgi:pyruvate dehydrogenase E1 component
LLHPQETPRRPFVAESLGDRSGPGIAATDYIHTFAEQIRPFVGRRYATLGTDGYGRSDFRRKLREFFEVNRYFVVLAALKALAEDGAVPVATVAKALKKYHIDPQKPNPVTV